jgi:nucleoside-diphosphate-sugar epimerase
MQLVLVTGATGKIGSALVRKLLQQKENVRAVVRPESSGKLPDGAEKFEFDLSSGALPTAAFEGVSHVVHLAGLVGSHRYHELLQKNAFATKNLLSNCPTHVQKAVLASSISVYGVHAGKLIDETFPPQPDTDYGRSKLVAENFARAYCPQLRIVFLRIGMVYGPGFTEGYYPVLSRIRNGKMTIIGDGTNRLPLVHIDDVVQAVLLAMEKKTPPCREYNIVGKEQPTQAELLKMAAGELGVAPPEKHAPLAIAKALTSIRALASAAGLAPRPGVTAHHLWQLSSDRSYSGKRAEEELGFEARVKIRDGLKEVVKLYLESEGGKLAV